MLSSAGASCTHLVAHSFVVGSATGSHHDVSTIISDMPQLHHSSASVPFVRLSQSLRTRNLALLLDSWTNPQSITWEGHSANHVPEAICHSTGFPNSICEEFCLLAGNWLTAPCWNWQTFRDSFSFSASTDEAQSKGANRPQERHVLPSSMPGKLGLEKAEGPVVSWSHSCAKLAVLFPS